MNRRGGSDYSEHFDELNWQATDSKAQISYTECVYKCRLDNRFHCYTS